MTTYPEFWKRTRRVGECIEWTGAAHEFGYGRLRWPPIRGGKFCYAHRVAWMLEHGPIPAGLYVLHRCDNRKCVNLEHLFLGTHGDNMADMLAKKRQAVGTRHGMSRLAYTTVQAIRRMFMLGATESELAAEFGVSAGYVSELVCCKKRISA